MYTEKELDLIDAFAMATLNGMVSSIKNQAELDRIRDWANKSGKTVSEFIAEDAYKQGKAMIEQRRKLREENSK